MREIKFRAWDEMKKIMHNRFQFIKSGDEGNDWIIFESDKERRNTTDPDKIIFNNPYFRQQLKIMQFTGLKDKNGKEIYEGDIVEFKGHWDGDKYTGNLKGYVEFFEGQWIISEDDEFLDDLYSHNLNDRIEVIGNKFENPELLK